MKRSYYKFIIFILSLTIMVHYSLFSRIRPYDTSDKDSEGNIFRNIIENIGISKDGKGKTVANRIYPNFHECPNIKTSKSFENRGQFWVINNYIKAEKEFHCNETITYTTHGEYYFLDNLVVLAEKWQGPISIAVYAPGADFDEAVKAIIYLRQCVSNHVKDFVTFHLYFEFEHFPPKIQDHSKIQIKCEETYTFQEPETLYRKGNDLLYPVNVGRNIARRNAATYFVFASDIELYPSINIIPEFLKMIERKDYTNSLSKRVFVLPVFEVKKEQKVPETKDELLEMFHKKDAIWFHEKICKLCHLPPGYEKWIKSNITPGLSVQKIGKRTKDHRAWEPFYIGTKDEPVFDERLSSEGRANKMTQAYAMCLQGYEYHVLDNAFLVHKPGIKERNKDVLFSDLVEKQNDLIFNKIVKEYKTYYGNRKGCLVMGKPLQKAFDEVRQRKEMQNEK